MTLRPPRQRGDDNPPVGSEGDKWGNRGSGHTSADTTASAATITAASSFSKFTNGSKYYYTNTTTSGQTAVTVNTSATWGAYNNPYVINNKEQWQLFVNTITNSDLSGNNANNSSVSGLANYALGADIDLGGCVVPPVGNGKAGFYGNLYGNKHTIKNGSFSYCNSPHGGESFHTSGLIGVLRGRVYDLTLDSTLSLSVPMGNTRILLVGSLCGWTSSRNDSNDPYALICNVVSKVNINLSNSSTTQIQEGDIGGLVGSTWSLCKIYKCLYQGNITYKAAGANVGGDNRVRIGGLVGRNNGSEIVIDTCAVMGNTLSESYGGVCMGSILGSSTANYVNKISNVVVNTTLSLPQASSAYTSPDIGIIGQTNGQLASGSSISDVYIIGGSPLNQIYSTNATAWDSTSIAMVSNIQTSATTSATVYPTALSSKVTKNGSSSATVTKAVADSQIAASFIVTSTGTVYSRLWQGELKFSIGSGSTGGPSNTVYTPSPSDQNVYLTAPSRTGYTFKGWSLTSATGSISGNTSYLTIPANTATTITAYAVWEVNAFTGTAPSDVTIVYGSSATLSAAGLSSPPGTSSSTYGVNISYEWRLSGSSSIIPPKGGNK